MTLLVNAPGIYMYLVSSSIAPLISFGRAQPCHQVQLADSPVCVDKHNLIVEVILDNCISVHAFFQLRRSVQIHDVRRFFHHFV